MFFSTITTSGTTEKPLTYKQLEENINKWVHELEEQESVFLNQAKQINIWDRLLIENGEQVFVFLVSFTNQEHPFGIYLI